MISFLGLSHLSLCYSAAALQKGYKVNILDFMLVSELVYKGHGLGGDAAGGGPEGAGGILCKAGIFDPCVDRLGTARQSEWRGDDGGNEEKG